jgi:hypothetical protein
MFDVVGFWLCPPDGMADLRPKSAKFDSQILKGEVRDESGFVA